MAVRINSSEGLILYAAGGQRGTVMSLGVSDGHLLLLLDGGKRKVSLRSRKKYDDGQWHTVRSHTIVGSGQRQDVTRLSLFDSFLSSHLWFTHVYDFMKSHEC